jgi:hypothetical protein
MNRKNIPLLLACCALIFALGACKGDSDVTSPTDGSSSVTVDLTSSAVSVRTMMAANQSVHELASDYVWDNSQVIPIRLNGTSIDVSSGNVTVSGTTATITSGGTYSISGTLSNGQILVNTSTSETVRLVLNGIDIANATTSPLCITSAKKVILVLADNSQNTITDPASYVFPSSDVDEPNAALFSKTDMTIYGNGALTVRGNYNDAIASKDGLIIKSGTITVTAADDGIRGKDYLAIYGGIVTVTAGGDGLKADNDENAARGYIYIESAVVSVTSGGDGLAAETDALIASGTLTLTTGGGSSRTVTGDLSAKGIKGVANVVISDGTFTISSADDAIHSNTRVVINGGTFGLSSGDDGIHADSILGINGGTIAISKCYEGIESIALIITNGNIHLNASDDGINGAGGNDGSAAGGWGGQMPTAGNRYLSISGGYVVVTAAGDGLDVNGSIVMSGGTVLVHGPTSNGDGPLDYDATFTMNGGTVVAAGSSGMAMAPSASSSQCSMLITFTSTKAANSIFRIQDSNGGDVLTFKPSKTYQSVAFSSPALTTGATYDIYLGGTCSGTLTDGLYSGGTYTGGTKLKSFTASGTVTKISG